MEELLPRPIEVPRRSPAPDVIAEISEKGAMFEWLTDMTPLERFDPPTLHKVLEHPPDGGEGWCNPDVEELTLLQPCDWFIK